MVVVVVVRSRRTDWWGSETGALEGFRSTPPSPVAPSKRRMIGWETSAILERPETG